MWQRAGEDDDEACVGGFEVKLLARLVEDGLDDDLLGVDLAATDPFAEGRQGDPVFSPEDLGVEVEGQLDPVVDEVQLLLRSIWTGRLQMSVSWAYRVGARSPTRIATVQLRSGFLTRMRSILTSPPFGGALLPP